jgi:hypothetical protein
MLRGKHSHVHIPAPAPHGRGASLPAAHDLEVPSSVVAQTWLRTISDQRWIAEHPQGPYAQIVRTAPVPLMSAKLISTHDSLTPVVVDHGRVDA